MLKLKMDGLTEMEKESVLPLDEMAMTPSVALHLGTRKLHGDGTLPGHTGVATHACCYVGREQKTMETNSGFPPWRQFQQLSNLQSNHPRHYWQSSLQRASCD